jgi:membrane protein required for colicin V production
VNWVDLVVLGILAISAGLAFLRGFVREVLGIGAWVGAGFFAAWSTPYVQERFEVWVNSPGMGAYAALATMFLVAVVILSVLAAMVGNIMRSSMLSGLDRSLGVAFGLVRGAALLAAAYVITGWAVPIAKWPPPVLQSRSLPYVYDTAIQFAGLLPDVYKPAIHAPPTAGETIKAEDLMRANPQGRAVGTP